MNLLGGLRVLEVGNRISTLYAAKVAADLGAEVTHISWRAPTDGVDPQSPFGRFLRGSTRSVVLDRADRDSVAKLCALARNFEVLFFDADDELTDQVVHGLTTPCSVVTISSYGLPDGVDVPPASEFTLQAESGAMSMHDGSGGRPVASSIALGEMTAGAVGTVAMLTSILRAQHGGDGRIRTDVSVLESLASILAVPNLHPQVEGAVPYLAPFRLIPSVEPASDGWVCIVPIAAHQWDGLVAMVGNDALKADEYRTPFGRLQNREAIEDVIQVFTRAHTVEELCALAEKHRVPISPVSRIDQVAEQLPYRERDSFATVDGMLVPRSPFRLIGQPAEPPGSAPPVGYHTFDVLAPITEVTQ
jgi:crotonobetainyl-CoA:carnitine CoA-transferase CaiB-like acyl-CoA transferase